MLHRASGHLPLRGSRRARPPDPPACSDRPPEAMPSGLPCNPTRFARPIGHPPNRPFPVYPSRGGRSQFARCPSGGDRESHSDRLGRSWCPGHVRVLAGPAPPNHLAAASFDNDQSFSPVSDRGQSAAAPSRKRTPCHDERRPARTPRLPCEACRPNQAAGLRWAPGSVRGPSSDGLL
jgi:hypothetical protein